MNEHKVLSPSASNSANAVLRAARSQGHMRSMSNNSNNLSVGGGSNSLSPDLSDDDDDDVLWRSGGGANGHLHHGAAHLQQQMQPPVDVLVGNLSKWTNYLHGWQERYFALKTDGNLVYYKSNNDTEFGCRGSISVQKAKVKRHDLDELRFDVSVNDCNWYLRARSVEDRQKWTDALENQKHHLQQQQQQQQLYGNNLKRHGSAHSLSSNSYSGSSSRPGGSAKARGLAEKLAEMETFRDIMCGQIDTLQAYFDSCADLEEQEQGEERLAKGGKDPTKQAVDFKGEAITFKATTAGIVATLGHCIDLMSQREEMWRRRLEREQAARRAAEDKARSAVEFASGDPSVPPLKTSPSVLPKLAPPPLPPKMQAPDYEEGPHSQLGEDEFFDAVEDALDRLEEEQSSIDQLKRMGSVGAQKESAGSGDEEDADWKVEAATRKHHLWDIIDKTTNEQLHYARLLPGGKDSVWELFAQDGEMRMYKREEEVDGMVVDPLKALHQVRGKILFNFHGLLIFYLKYQYFHRCFCS